MPKPKVAYILKMFPRFSETFILSEILELERSGVDVTVFSLKRPNDPRRHADVDKVQAPITYAPQFTWGEAWKFVGPHLRLLAQNPRRYLKTARRALRKRRWGAVKRFLQAGYIAPKLQDAGITHVHAHFASSATSVSQYINQLIGMGFSFTAHAKDIYIETVADNVLARKMNAARFVVTVSDYNVEHLSGLAPNANLTRIYNGLDLTTFAPNGIQPDETPLVLAVGRLVEKKGFDDLIRAVAILRDRGVTFRTEIVGAGGEEQKLRDLIEELHVGDIVTLAGPIPREDLIKLYPRATVFAAPSVVGKDGNRDGLPTVLIEAMALGVPVIATPVTGIPELVRDGETGQIVPERAPEELADAIQRAIQNPQWNRDLARNGRALVEERFDLTRNVAELRELFEKVSLS